MTQRRNPAACQCNCAGGQPCACNDHIGHTVHICKDPACVCHAPAAYGLEMVDTNHGTVYVPLLRRLYVDRGTEP